ncbi:hypothetical protein ACFQ67_00510 [Streptomyces sp. NPDC056488]|uniref:hypothetical protein n=1 Tax=Streptomyces sp. NPDC056488 TaxID=3345836 RepID=UPI0036AD1A60
MNVYTALRLADGLSSAMFDALHILATNPQGALARRNLGKGGGTHGALYRRGLIDQGVDERGQAGYFLTPKAWAFLRAQYGTVRPADAGRLDLDDALAAAHPAEQPVADEQVEDDDQAVDEQPVEDAPQNVVSIKGGAVHAPHVRDAMHPMCRRTNPRPNGPKYTNTRRPVTCGTCRIWLARQADLDAAERARTEENARVEQENARARADWERKQAAKQQPVVARNAFEQAAEGLLDAPQAGTVHLYVCEAPSYLCDRGRCSVSSTRAVGSLEEIRASAHGFRHAWAVNDQGHHTVITSPVLPAALRCATHGAACDQDPKAAHSFRAVAPDDERLDPAVEQFKVTARVVDAVEYAEQVEASVDTVVEAEALYAARLVTEAEATAGTWRGAWIGRTDPGVTLFDLDPAGQGALFV